MTMVTVLIRKIQLNNIYDTNHSYTSDNNTNNENTNCNNNDKNNSNNKTIMILY